MPWISRKTQQTLEGLAQITLDLVRVVRDFETTNRALQIELRASHEAWLRIAKEIDEVHRYLVAKEAASTYEHDRERPMIIVESGNKGSC